MTAVEKLIITKEELKILKVLKKYPQYFIGKNELFGYFQFLIDMDVIMAMLYNLEKAELIEKRQVPAWGYFLTENGNKYLWKIKHDRRNKLKNAFRAIVGAGLLTVFSVIVERLLKK